MKHVHFIDQSICTKCGSCLEVCPPKIGAVVKVSGDDALNLEVLDKPIPVKEFRAQGPRH